MRIPAASLEEICTRHGCVESIDRPDALSTSVLPYATSAITWKGDNAVITSLHKAFPTIRGGHELEEIYVRPAGEVAFSPIVSKHLSCQGSIVVVVRKRHPIHDPKIVGIMLAKDEADIIPDVIASLFPPLDALYFHADDATRDAILASSPTGKAHELKIQPPPGVRDGYRQALLELVRSDVGDDHRPTWILVVQGDEVYSDDILHHIRLAQIESATVMNAQVPTYVLHESQHDGFDWTLPIEKRLTHYIWGGSEHAGFLDFPWVYYRPEEHMRAHPHGLYPAKWASARPIRKHYPFRNPSQARARIADRIASGWQPNYAKYNADVFVGDTAFGLPVKMHYGWFGETERVEGIW